MYSYKIIPLYQDYAINELGIVKHIKTDTILVEQALRKVRLCLKNKDILITVARLLAITFLSNNNCNDLSKLFVYYIDNDSNNIDLDNLLLLTRQEFEVEKYKAIENELSIKYPTSIYKTDGYYPDPWEVVDYPGFYRIPFTDDFTAINKEGKLLFLKNGLEKKKYITTTGYWASNFLVNGKRTIILIHRILGMLFLPIPVHLGNYEMSELNINHKDGIKCNIDLDNLEWCTKLENREHACQTGLIILRPVLRRNYLTNEVTRYESIRHCCNDNLLSKDMMYKHLYSNYAGMIRDGEYIYKFDNGEPWPFSYNIPDSSVNLWRKCDVVARNVDTNEIILFRSLRNASDYLKLNHVKLQNIRHRKGKDYPYDGWIFYPLDKENFKRTR